MEPAPPLLRPSGVRSVPTAFPSIKAGLEGALLGAEFVTASEMSPLLQHSGMLKREAGPGQQCLA